MNTAKRRTRTNTPKKHPLTNHEATQMSLKTFHFVFIVASIIFAGGFGAWCLLDYRETQNTAYLAMGVISFASELGLAAYGVYALKKLKGFSYL